MKKIISYILSVFIVLQAASGFALAENSAGAEYHIPESDYLYVDGDNRIRTVEGEQTLLFRLFVGEPQRVHILTSGVNVTLVIYNEAADAVVGAFTSVDGLLDAPFDAAPGSYLLGLSGWGEVAILAASEARTAQIYAQTTAPAPADETDTPAEEAVTEESTEEPAETPAEEPAEAEASESEPTPTELTDEPPAAEVTPAATDEVAPAAADESTPVPAEATEQSEALGESDEPLAAEDTSAAAEASSKEFATEEPVDEVDSTDEIVNTNVSTESETMEPSEEILPTESPESTEELPDESAPSELADEQSEDVSNELTSTTEDQSAVTPVEEPTEADASESEPIPTEPAFDSAQPITASIPMDQTVSLLSILTDAGAPVNVITYLSGATEGRVVAVSQNGDWLLTPYAYFDGLTLSVTATDYLAANPEASAVTLTVVLSNPDPAASMQEFTAVSATGEAAIGDLTEENAAKDEPAEDELTAEDPETDSPVLPGARVTVDRVDINEICLRADVSDFANPDVLAYQWQYSLDGETWMDIPGATESTFSFALDETSSTYYWRLLTSEKDVTLNG